MQDISEVRLALLGCGYWGRNLARVFRELGVLKLVCDKSTIALEEVGEKHGIPTSIDLSAAIDDPDIDAIAVATPAATHHEVAKRALNAGKHVFVEKPMALRVREGRDLVDTAQANDRILMVGHILQYHAAVIKLQEMVQSGELGKLRFISSHRLNFGKIRQEENALWSFAPHDISVMLSLTGQAPEQVSCQGGSFLNHEVADITTTHLDFPNGVKGHLFMSWLHPFKEQKLVVVGDRRMAVFDDVEKENKLMIFDHEVEWENHQPVARKSDGEAVALDLKEPLKEECIHFLESIIKGAAPKTDGSEGLLVLETLKACQRSLETGSSVRLSDASRGDFQLHESSYVDDDVDIGDGTRIWHFSHLMKGSRIGANCSIGQNVTVGPQANIGSNVKIQNNVSVYEGVTLEDDVFCGPSMVFTNVMNPRSEVSRKSEFKNTLIKKGATLGANCTIVCGNTVGRYAFVAAGAVVTNSVPDFALVAGVPAKRIGWMSANGQRLHPEKIGAIVSCPATGKAYKLMEEDRLVEVGSE